jgi:hypothetical protein
VRLLPEEAMRQFFVEFMETAEAASDLGTINPILPLIASWKSTAEVYADPDLARELMNPEGGDYGVVEPPEAAAE